MAATRPALHRQEVARLRVLDALAILDTPPEPAFDALVRAARRATDAATASLNLVTAQQVWSKAAAGPAPKTSPRATSPCAQVVATGAAWVQAGDTADEPATASSPPAPAYAGVPLHVDGLPVGTLCVCGAPPPGGPSQWLPALQDLAVLAEALLAARARERREGPMVAPDHPRPHGLPLHEVDQHQQAEQALRDKMAAEMASRSKSEFMSRMSHEMRTPLNAIIGFAQLLRLQSGARLDHVEHILDAGRHLLTLVNDVLDLQRAETGDLALRPESVALAPLIEDCMAMLQPMADARGVRQQFDAPPVAAHVQADAQRLRQVLLNVASNAVKYNRPAGLVAWSVSARPDGRWTVGVEDTGAGMTADQMARLFQPFERLGRDTSAIEGTGLGLVIARRLVDSMGGELDIDSTPGEGTRMAITLSAAEAPQAPAGLDVPRSATPGPPAAAPLRLLYVEDNRINALLFEEAMRRHAGFDLRVVEDGAEALGLVRDWRPDVLVLDANLPGANGHEVLRRLREVEGLADAPAFMCSADAMPEDVQRALDAGFLAYWTKPLDIEAIVDDLRRVRPAVADHG